MHGNASIHSNQTRVNTYVFLVDVRVHVQIVDAHGSLEWVEQGTLDYPIGGPHGHIWFGRVASARSGHHQRELLRNEHLGFHVGFGVVQRLGWFMVGGMDRRSVQLHRLHITKWPKLLGYGSP